MVEHFLAAARIGEGHVPELNLTTDVALAFGVAIPKLRLTIK